MKRVKINAWRKGLVFKNNKFVRLLNEGTYWLSPFVTVTICDMDKPLVLGIDAGILLNDAALNDAVIFIDVKDNEMVLKYENNLFKEVLTPGRYIFWKGLIDYRFVTVDLRSAEIAESIDKTILLRKELNAYVRTSIVDTYEKGVLYLDGKFSRILDAGTYFFWKNNTTVYISKCDMRIQQMEVAGQEILTKDKASLRINFYLQYQVNDLIGAIVNNKDYDKQLYVLAQLALREFVGSYTLDELLERKEKVSEFILNALADKIEPLGVIIKSCGIRDIILPGDMKDIMNQVLVAEKKAQANTIMRREETASTRSLLNTAKLMEDNAMLFKLKEMEYVERIAEKINTISLSGGNQVVDQLKQIFAPGK